MKTTVEVPDDLYRKAKATAALRGKRIKDLVEEGLRLIVERQTTPPIAETLAELMRGSIGVVNSGIGDLASNPKHMRGYGREPARRRG